MRRYVGFLYIGIFVVLVGVFFQKVFWGKLPVPSDTLIGLYHPWLDQAATTNPAGVPFKNFLITDPIRQQIPWRKQIVDEWKNGKLPTWNPYNFSGTPLAANVQTGAFYPLNILFFFLPFIWAWTALVIMQPLLAGIFMYLYLRSKNVEPGVATFGGITWSFCGFAVAWLTWGTIVHTALWLPLTLLAIDHILSAHKAKQLLLWAVILAASLILTIFAGHIQIAFYAGILSFAYLLWSLSVTKKRKNIRWLVGGAVAAIVVTSVQWLPLVSNLTHSGRVADPSVWLKDGWFLPWQHLIQFVAPDFFGNPATLNYWGVWNYGEFIGYIGFLPLMLAVYALFSRSDTLAKFFAVMIGLVLLFLLPTPIARLPFQLQIPFLSTLQPTRLMVLVDIALVMLAALGLDTYVRKPDKKILLGIGAGGLILGALWLYVLRVSPGVADSELVANLVVSKRNLILPSALWAVGSFLLFLFLFLHKWKQIFLIMAIGIVSFDLFRFGWKFTPFTPVAYFFPATQAISFLQQQPKPFRIMSLDARVLPPNVNAYYGIESVEGYDPVYDSRYEEFIAALNRKEPNISPPFGFNRIITSPTIDSPLLPLLNVQYVLTLEDLTRTDVELVFREGNTRTYQYKHALPRIYPVEKIIEASSKQQVMNILYDPSFRPTQTAVVEQLIDLIGTPLTLEDSIEILSYTSSRIRVHTRFLNDRFVVIANVYNPGWHATVDTKPTAVYRTNYIFQGVIVPKGEHVVELTYR